MINVQILVSNLIGIISGEFNGVARHHGWGNSNLDSLPVISTTAPTARLFI